ncbi:hypothetical protein TcasGA2_TC004272 [Tribolium castaneum]|uniref:Uncharacterized protein n=1 Tax=Tribolium castaneum TaxID=7070 RepID=D7EL77_TRICA|nr:hypothetical protein TcasGA2_TC004272 [Tribolium castaneum]
MSEAEEGEEDTPSEDSNAIIEVGEEIRTESERSSDESYESGSFIDDNDDHKLLSGEEYDLSWDSPEKFSRIVKLSSGSDDEIVNVKKREKKPLKKPRKSRIIKCEDSSDEDEKLVDENKSETEKNSNEEQKKIIILENVKVQDIQNKELSEGINQVLKNILSQSSINSSTDTNLTPNGQVRKKKRKPKKKQKMNGSLQIDNKNEEEQSTNVQITAKRKLPNSDDSLPLQPPLKKKKKNRKRQKRVEECSQLSLIDEAIKQTPVLKIELTNDWDIEDIQLKPTRLQPCKPKPKSEKSPKETEQCHSKDFRKPKSGKSPKVEKAAQFHSKDFRNLMLYDTSRNRRTDTKSLLHKKF